MNRTQSWLFVVGTIILTPIAYLIGCVWYVLTHRTAMIVLTILALGCAILLLPCQSDQTAMVDMGRTGR